MFDLFGKKKRKTEMLNRAFAEFSLRQFGSAIRILNELEKEDKSDFRVFDLRGKVLMAMDEFLLSLRAFNISISLEPDLRVNANSYLGREVITRSLESGEIRASVPELLQCFQAKNLALLIYESLSDLRNLFPNLTAIEEKKFQILALEYSVMRIEFDNEFSILGFFNSTISTRKEDLGVLVVELKQLIFSTSVKYCENIDFIGSELRILKLADIYISHWCKDIKLAKTKSGFL